MVQYNLLLTTEFFALIRRSKEHTRGISINALGFAGYFLAKDQAEYEYIYMNGIDKILSDVVKPIWI